MNNLKTFLLLTALTVGLVVIGGMLGGSTGAVIAFGIAVVMNVGSYWMSDRLVLARYRATEISEAEAPELYSIVADLAQRASMPMPKVYVLPDDSLNAFATGRNPSHAAVAVTRGLLANLDRAEVAGVLAHELSHVRHRDTLIMTITATMAGAISMIGSFIQWTAMFGGLGGGDDDANPIVLIAVGIFAGLAAGIVQMAISRSREFEADAGAARLLGDAMPLMAALQKLELGSQQLPTRADAATAHLFIAAPFTGRSFAKLFMTHPPIDERIEALRALAGHLGPIT